MRPAMIILFLPKESAKLPKITCGRVRASCFPPFMRPDSATVAPAATARVPVNLSMIVSETDWAAPVR